MKVLITGTREAQNSHTKFVVKALLENTVGVPKEDIVLICGGARGVDAIACGIGSVMGLDVIVVPADWDTLGKAAGPIRNQRMLDEQDPDLVLAFPSTLHPSRGTTDMMRRAKAAGIKTVVTWL